MRPDFALVALAQDGRVIGVAGFKTSQGALTGGGIRDLAPDALLMDGICVDASARDMGVGTAQLAAIKEEARTRGLAIVRPDVNEINPRPRALYEREGFAEGKVQRLGPLRHFFGFSYSTPMT